MLLRGRLEAALARLNPALPPAARAEALRKLANPDRPSLVANNHAVHRLLVDGVTVEYQRADGSIAGAQVQVIDFDEPANNDWLAVNQFTVIENQHNRRPDMVLFVNGLPLAVIELKNAADENATIWHAFQPAPDLQGADPLALRLQRRAGRSPTACSARIGTLTAGPRAVHALAHDRGRGRWRRPHLPELRGAARGRVRAAAAFSTCVRYFIVFEDMGGGTVAKKMAGYHQFHAVNVALGETLRASLLADEGQRATEPPGRYDARAQADGEPGDRRVGVVWHTQGSGKSLTMAFYAGRVILHPAMENPTIVVLTDRNDLDDQLFGTFARCRELLRQPPVQAESRDAPARAAARGLRAASSSPRSRSSSAGRTKGEPGIRGARPTRRNIVVIADEAHRSQYDFIDGFARHMRDALPNASFIGFTGTPIELTDANTRAVFGDYISVYDIQRAVEDGATVPIYYESRLAKLAAGRGASGRRSTPEFEEVTEGEEVERKEKLKSKWAQLEARGRRREAPQAGGRGPGRALRAAAGGDGRQGDDRLHEPAHLRGPVRRDRRAAARAGTTPTTTRARSRS